MPNSGKNCNISKYSVGLKLWSWSQTVIVYSYTHITVSVFIRVWAAVWVRPRSETVSLYQMDMITLQWLNLNKKFRIFTDKALFISDHLCKKNANIAEFHIDDVQVKNQDKNRTSVQITELCWVSKEPMRNIVFKVIRFLEIHSI